MNCTCGHHVDGGGHDYPGGACATPGCWCQYVEFDDRPVGNKKLDVEAENPDVSHADRW